MSASRSSAATVGTSAEHRAEAVPQPETLLAIAQSLVEQGTSGEQIEVTVGHSRSSTVRAYEGEVESYTSATSAAIGVQVIVEGKVGYASAGSLDEDVIRELVDQARVNARFAQVDEWAAVAEPDGQTPIDIVQFREDLLDHSPQDKIALALDLERRVRAADPRITTVRTASYGDSMSAFALATSTGIAVAERGTSAGVGVHCLAADGDRAMSGGAGDAAIHPDGLDLDHVVNRSVRQAVELIGAVKPATGPVTLVLDPWMTASIMGLVSGTLNGDPVTRGRSPFIGRIGEAVAVPQLQLYDDPHDSASLGASGIDGEGMATRRVPLITDGVLEGFLFDGYTGRRYGTTSTASAQRGARSLPSPGPHVLAVGAGTNGTLDDLIASVEYGIFVFSFAGFHSGVNPVSGDVSLGVDGRMIRNGALAEPVSEATIGSTIQRLLMSISQISSDRRYLSSGVVAPSMTIADVMLSGAK